MINVDISNVWNCVSLPELLGTEKEVFDAHNLLRDHKPGGPDFLSWLTMPPSLSARYVHSVRTAADRICDDSDVLVVCGTGGPFQGAEAAIDLYCGKNHNLKCSGPQVIFVGDSLSGRQWVELTQLLDDRDYSLHLISADGKDLCSNVISRGLRWLLERKYGPATKSRITVSTIVGSPLHRMAQEEGYELFPLLKELGGIHSTLSAAALLPMAVAGIDPQSVLDGAARCYRETDVRSFENPVWLYAAARHVLSQKGRNKELLCFFDHDLETLGRWWQRQVWRHGCREDVGITVETALLPGDLEAMHQMVASGRSGTFETMLHFTPISKQIPVEMDWKDYDGLGFLSGKNLEQVQNQLMQSMIESHNDAGVPILDIQAGDLVAETIGELFCFFELSSALTAAISGIDPFDLDNQGVNRAALQALGSPRV